MSSHDLSRCADDAHKPEQSSMPNQYSLMYLWVVGRRTVGGRRGRHLKGVSGGDRIGSGRNGGIIGVGNGSYSS